MEEHQLLRSKLNELKYARSWPIYRLASVIGIATATLERFLRGGHIQRGGRVEDLIINTIKTQDDGLKGLLDGYRSWQECEFNT